MKKTSPKIDDSLIISRLEQKELSDIKPAMAFDSRFFPLVTKTSLKPFFDNLAIKLGLKLQLIGGTIVNAQVDRGYFHHGLEELLTELSPHDAVFALEHLDKKLPIFYQVALMIALEHLVNLPKDNLTAKKFAIALEFGRVFHHLKVIKNILYCLDLTSIAALVIDCENVFPSPLYSLCRIHSGSAFQTQSISCNEINLLVLEALAIMETITDFISREEQLIKRLSKKSLVNLTMASSMGLTGLYLRSNRNHYDLRHQNTQSNIYHNAPHISLTEGGDAWARFILRLLEIDASLKWIRNTLLTLAKELHELKPITIREDYCQEKLALKFAFAEIEGPEGVIKVSIFVNNVDNSLIFRIRTPAYFIAQTIPYLLLEIDLKDIPLTLYSLGITAEEVDK